MKSFDNLNNWREEFLIQVYLCSFMDPRVLFLVYSPMIYQFEILQTDDVSNLQASPSDPENFPFVVIGNKIDVDGGNSRVVRTCLNFVLPIPSLPVQVHAYFLPISSSSPRFMRAYVSMLLCLEVDIVYYRVFGVHVTFC